jgi:hypothetical protein
MRKWLHIVLLLVVAVSCGPRRIPRDDMERIMADILIQDQQIKNDRSLRKQADTSLVYEGIFEAYGYNTDDYLYSVEYYLQDPARMEKIMGAVAENLEKEIKLTGEEVDLENWRRRFLDIYRMKVDTTRLPRPRTRPVDTLHVRFDADSVWFYRDSL